jgi:hypothetical protein
MDRFEREILDFIRSWAPYGGPPADEVWTEFGMSHDQLMDRVQQIVSQEAARREYELQRPWLRVRANAASSADRTTSATASRPGT